MYVMNDDVGLGEDYDIRNGQVDSMTYGQLRTQVALYASAMRALGVVCGDVVVGVCSYNIRLLIVYIWIRSYTGFHRKQFQIVFTLLIETVLIQNDFERKETK